MQDGLYCAYLLGLACVLTGVSCHIWQWTDTEATLLRKANALSVTTCKKVFHSADYLRALQLDFLNTINEEAPDVVDDLATQLTILGVEISDVDDMKFVWGVTVDEIEFTVNKSYHFVSQVLLVSGSSVCPRLLRHEDQGESFEESVTNLFKFLYYTKVEVRTGVTEVRTLIEQFFDFVMAMLEEPQIKQPGDEKTTRLNNILKVPYQRLIQYIVKIVKARRALVEDTLNFSNTLKEQTYLRGSAPDRILYI